MHILNWKRNSLIFRAYIQPSAKQDAVIGLYNDESIKIAISSLPEDGKANLALTKFLAKKFNVSKSKVIIKKGHASRYKLIEIQSPREIPPELRNIMKLQD